MRIAFLFSHDQVHQVAHSLPIALALARGGFTGEIIVATTNQRIAAEVLRLGAPLVGTRIQHVELQLKPGSARLSRLLGRIGPAARTLIYRDNLDFFRSLDALIVSEKASLMLRKVHGLKRPLLIHTRHGAGDRAIGFDASSAGFDHVLCSGPKIRDRLIRDAGVPPDRISVVGYAKFDIARPSAQWMGAAPKRPVVVYNPHPSPHLSSWYRHGRDLLDFFASSEDYQLIFAPHVMLFERQFVITIDRLRMARPGRIDLRFLKAPNIHVDLGSRACTDMTYTNAADIYIGDASSQVYEFLYRPRPCLFLNSHGFRWQGDPNFEHWRAGPVIDSPEQLAAGLQEAVATHQSKYRPVQEEMLRRTFDITDKPSCERAAEAVMQVLERHDRQPPTPSGAA